MWLLFTQERADRVHVHGPDQGEGGAGHPRHHVQAAPQNPHTIQASVVTTSSYSYQSAHTAAARILDTPLKKKEFLKIGRKML